MAGLNFPDNADYKPEAPGKDNVAPFEFIPWLLGQCADLAQAKELLARVNLIRLPFSADLPLSPLHWMISDRSGSITVECVRGGLWVYDNPVGVLTNNPPFDFQMLNLTNYMGLSRDAPVNRFCPELDLKPYCLGMGAMGPARRSVLRLPLCPGGLYPAELCLGRLRIGECQPVFPHTWQRGAAAGLRTAGKRQL